MDELHKDDIEILDKIIQISLSKERALIDDLPKLPEREYQEGENLVIESFDRELMYYSRLLKIIQLYGVAKVVIGTSNCTISAIPETTQRFLDSGGFRYLFLEQLAERERNKILRQKETDDAMISKWTKRTYWFTFGIAIAGLIVAVIAFIRTL